MKRYMSLNIMTVATEQLQQAGFSEELIIHYQLHPDELIQQTIEHQQGSLSDSGALVINTGEFTGRSPDDRFFVKDSITANVIDWNHFNIPIDEKYFHLLKDKMLSFLNEQEEIWVRDCYACAHKAYRTNIRVVNEKPWSNLFAYNMFLRPEEAELDEFTPEWTVIQAESFKADPAVDGTRKHNFTIVSFTDKTILIGGSGYTGEIKKGIFSVLNFVLPHDKGVLSMHCSANLGKDGDTAIFFGLSGTGKTTLSADPERFLIGDDEHGWTNDSVFNFEGGCYAKTINLCAENEPEIFAAIRHGALVENTPFVKGTNTIDYTSAAITENTRVSYPLSFIKNSLDPAIGPIPKNIFFLTCDAAGVLPPISKLSPGQAMYQFISGYTAKVAGTEEGIKEPESTFSACFGAPFMPLHPGFYAELLGKKLKEHNVNVWLINTGWSGGSYGVGQRIKLKYTRAMIGAALQNQLDNIACEAHPVFGFMIPASCPNVPSEILQPKNTWADKKGYDEKARNLANLFITNFQKYSAGVSEEILKSSPQILN
ncbi:MAG: phosphoenolpyruvate carboxykinase (ATP) [Chitinophagaceae bacterium]|nr:phosphoenolpyruvate carboxykinase (ATP) [Chitinophagaceae bacterium]